MKKESNIIDTKDNMIKNFTKEQMEIYEYYKKQFVCADNESYPVVQNDKEMVLLEKSYNILKTIFKVETVLALIIVTSMIIFNGFSANKSQIKYKHANINNIHMFNDIL